MAQGYQVTLALSMVEEAGMVGETIAIPQVTGNFLTSLELDSILER